MTGVQTCALPIYRALIGFPIGISIGNLIMILISLGWANGYYSPCVPDLITAMGNEINAVIIQTVLCGLLGSGFSVSSVIWEIEDWSIVKQTGIYFLMFSVNSSKQSRRRSRYNTYNKSLPIVVYGGSCFEIMIDLVVRICVSCFR